MKAHYRRGGLGDVIVKRFLANVLNDTLEPIRKRRRVLEEDIPAVYKILEEGSARAREVASYYAYKAKRAMGLLYFEDKKTIEKQQKAFKRKHEEADKLAAYLAQSKK